MKNIFLVGVPFPYTRRCQCALLCMVLMMCSACGGGSSDAGASTGLSRDIGLGTAAYVVLDLDAKTFTPVNAISDATTNSSYKTNLMIFRRVEITAGTIIGSATTSFGYELDEAQHSVAEQEYFIAIFEMTQGQCARILGSTPWDSVLSTELSGVLSTDDGMPAFNVSPATLLTALSTYTSGQDFSLRYPSNEEWELAARGASATDYPWGDGPTSAFTSSTGFATTTIAVHARLQESLGDETGPLAVGSLAVNELGMYDMIGNVWEYTSEGNIRGADWRSPVARARTADVVAFDQDIAHPSVGFRLIIER